MLAYINHNGTIVQKNEAILLVDNMSYRYGYGLFETMKLINNKIILEELHFDRLFFGLEMLKFELNPSFQPEQLKEQIIQLGKKNNCEDLARIRLSVYGGNGDLTDKNEKAGYVIECWPLGKERLELNEKGLIIDIYPDARKSCDAFSNLKTASFLTYKMAAKYAQVINLDDAILLNSHQRICETSIANIFLVKENSILTPPLSEGCVNGTIRRYLINKLRQDSKFTISEQPLTISDLENADEVFLTNAISGIRWAKQFRKKTYLNVKSTALYNQFIACLLS